MECLEEGFQLWLEEFFPNDKPDAGKILVLKFAFMAGVEYSHKKVGSLIKNGDLQGNGFDKTAERNGVILAANRLMEVIEMFSIDSLFSEVFKHKVKLECHNCKHIFADYEYEEEYDEDSLMYGDSETLTLLLSCPCCDEDWEKNCGIDFRTYPHIKEAII